MRSSRGLLNLKIAQNNAINQICLYLGSTSDREEEKIAAALNCTNFKLGGRLSMCLRCNAELLHENYNIYSDKIHMHFAVPFLIIWVGR